VTSGNRGRGAERELRRHLEQRLPQYLVPAVIVLRKALPLASDGGPNRAALSAPEQLRFASDAA
jgi:acyl-CoA synthetase (AMP-forming)/AMP-acid ligase II